MSEDQVIGGNLNGQAQGELRHLIERIERLEDEKSEVADQIKEVYAEAGGRGFDKKIMRKTIRQRKIDKAKGREAKAMLEVYCLALGDPELADLI